jgi:thiol-disulfide isomerase/thioredoxin
LKYVFIFLLTLSCSPNLETLMLKDPELTQELVLKHLELFDQLDQRDPFSDVLTIEEAIALYEQGNQERLADRELSEVLIKEGNQLAHDIVLEDIISGEPMALSAWQGKPLIVDFWASWCVPCLARKGTIKKIQELYPDRFAYVGIFIADDNIQKAHEILQVNAINYPTLNDAEGAYSEMLPSVSLPKTLIVDGSFKIRGAIEGFGGVAQDLDDFKKIIEGL